MNNMTVMDILYRFEIVWEIKLAEITSQRKQARKCKLEGKKIEMQKCIDLSELNELADKLMKIDEIFLSKNIPRSTIFDKMPNKKISDQQHETYLEYAIIYARFNKQVKERFNITE